MKLTGVCFLLVFSVLPVTSIGMLLYASLTLKHLNHCLVCGAQKQSRTIIRVKAVMLIYRELGLAAVTKSSHKGLIMTKQLCITCLSLNCPLAHFGKCIVLQPLAGKVRTVDVIFRIS